eukprot:Gregarina_sp_Poly_1__6960@NODE_378_length_9084_cov_115_952201_g311_i0_p8_GENE_NODE_378_length_9084_cov_115_952201_g311_i0NODE_378_length_9084_cov_115_952201_g311_i0_p8_ORF_typecomplete_len125_score17_93_NODE_378_length_9084_cov_115_952201_g311_i030093383
MSTSTHLHQTTLVYFATKAFDTSGQKSNESKNFEFHVVGKTRMNLSPRLRRIERERSCALTFGDIRQLCIRRLDSQTKLQKSKGVLKQLSKTRKMSTDLETKPFIESYPTRAIPAPFRNATLFV